MVIGLIKSIENQGYSVFFDNFYTGVNLLKELLLRGTCACGTINIIKNRRGEDLPQH